MDATRDREPEPEPEPDLTEIEALCVWTAERLRRLTWTALVGGGYDPDVYDIALLAHRAAHARAAARRPSRPPATGGARGVPSGGRGPG